MDALNTITDISPSCEGLPGKCSRPSIVEELNHRKQILTAALVDVNAALDALQAHPEVSNVLELIRKAR